jgi:exportin-1
VPGVCVSDVSSHRLSIYVAQHCSNSEVFQLCHEVLEKANKPSLIKATLETLLRFLNWIPLGLFQPTVSLAPACSLDRPPTGYIFETDIIDQLVGKFLEVYEFRNIALKCLSEIGALQLTAAFDSRFVILFSMVMTKINAILPPNTGNVLDKPPKPCSGLTLPPDIAGLYNNSSDADQEFVLNLALFLTNFLSAHLNLVENADGRDVLLNAHLYLVKISQVEEREVFKVCLEYWSKLVAELYDELQSLPMGDMNPLMGINGPGAGFGVVNAGNGPPPLRKDFYADILSNLRLVMIERMVKPEEVKTFYFWSIADRQLNTLASVIIGLGCGERRGRDCEGVLEGDRHYCALQEHA